jgi:hypothetical protein
MTLFGLTFEEGDVGARGSATYRRRDLALIYSPPEDQLPTIHFKRGRLLDPRLGIYEHPVFLIADTLTLRFDEDRTLSALDAYTNADNWLRTDLVADVELSGTGRLMIDWRSESDRVRLPDIPEFVFAERVRTLHIYLGPASSLKRYFVVGEGLIVGIEAGEIREIVFPQLTMT